MNDTFFTCDNSISINRPSIKNLVTSNHDGLMSLMNRIEKIRNDIGGNDAIPENNMPDATCMLSALEENNAILNYCHVMISDIEQYIGLND